MPFERMAAYFRRNWCGTCYMRLPSDEEKIAEAADLSVLDIFAERLRAALA